MDLHDLENQLSQILTQHELIPGQVLRLNEPEVFQLLVQLGMNTAPIAFLKEETTKLEIMAWAEKASELAMPLGRLLLKVVGREILHKTEAGGVVVLGSGGGVSPGEILEARDQLLTQVQNQVGEESIEGVLAAGFVDHKPNTPGNELIISLRQDDSFGPVIVVGVGGTLTEWYGQGSGGQSTLIFPAADFQRESVAKALLAHPMLSIFCKPSRLYPQAPISVSSLTEAMAGMAALGVWSQSGDHPWFISEIEINPLVVSEGKLVALDGVGGLQVRAIEPVERPVQKIAQLLAPKSAAVLGVSAKGSNPGRIILDNLLQSPGIDSQRLVVVHGREKSIAGVPCYPDVASLPEKVDLAVVSIPAEGALQAIDELVKYDMASSIILIPGGFAEAGRKDLAQAIETKLDEAHQGQGGGPVMVGGNCLGIVSRDQYNTFFLPRYKLPFNSGHGENLALVSQSGAYLVTFASNYDGLISPRASISYGNQMDLTVADFLGHFLDVPEAQVIACYVEGFRQGDGARFLELARKGLDQGKRIIIYKAGKTPLGAQAAASHTASLAGDYSVARTCLENAGIIVADSLGHFEDLIMAFTLLADKAALGRRTGIISNAGFECSTVMDQLAGLELAEFDSGTQAVLDEVLPGFAHRTNPIDCTPMTGTEAFVGSCKAILDCPTVDAAILSSVPVTPALNNLPKADSGAHGEDLTDSLSQPSQMIEVIHGSAKPAVVVVDSGSIYDPMCRMLLVAGIPVFRKIDRAARALAAFCAVTKR